ncbi:uncharacterized protein Pyn_35255 [Prunus yedoensis var. nudiflora]|uniref:Uncharacterized protein n=1 Tax=Prunus yedoensis var. nudiflora TaxID=2094558 RepID=A0A314ZG49_PRUYE|nr:uncharacterized protein Pyn_35255 [Prunus yedoensis var. nudiflora]
MVDNWAPRFAKISLSPSVSFSSDGFVLSVLELLPAAILAPASVLSLEDRQVLAYLITRSMKTIPNISSIPTQDPRRIFKERPQVHQRQHPPAPNVRLRLLRLLQKLLVQMGLFPQPRAHPPSHRSLRRSPGQRREDQEEQRQRQEKRQAEPSRGPKSVDVAAEDSIFPEENAQVSHELAIESSGFGGFQ